MDITQAMSWIGTVIGLIIGIPQIIKTIKTKSAKDVSAITFALILLTCLCFLTRAIAIKETAFICYYTFIIMSSSLQLYLIWKYQE